jgi:putative FmdB family regulatory protein
MPTYEYKCEACGFEFEKFQSITAAPIKKCPKCGKNRVKRLIGTGAGLIFKGGGFYITDYRSEAYKSAAKADSGAASPAKDSAGGSPAESKPAVEGKSSGEKTSGDKPSAEKPAAKAPAESKQAPAAKASKSTSKRDR